MSENITLKENEEFVYDFSKETITIKNIHNCNTIKVIK
jgi:hypothetical protein